MTTDSVRKVEWIQTELLEIIDETWIHFEIEIETNHVIIRTRHSNPVITRKEIS